MSFSNNMIMPISKSKPLFCEEYWKNIAKNAKPNKDYKSRVSTSFYIHNINNYFINGYPNMKKYTEHEIKMPIYKFLAKTDREFKQLTPTKDYLILWRGISPPIGKKAKKRNMRFEQAYNCKTGDTVCLPEYAFATDKIKHALIFAQDCAIKDSIVYEIHVPEGSKIHRSTEYIFPRYSKFECLDTQNMDEEGVKYKLIKLKYIQPNEVKLNPLEKLMRYFRTKKERA